MSPREAAIPASAQVGRVQGMGAAEPGGTPDGAAMYARDGLFVLDDVLSAAEVAELLATAENAFAEVPQPWRDMYVFCWPERVALHFSVSQAVRVGWCCNLPST